VRQLRRARTPFLEVTPEVFHSMAQGDDPQGLAAVVRQEWASLEEARPEDGLCWIAASTIQSPGNLGTVLRTSDAVGGAGLFLLGGAADPYDGAMIRASMGALFSHRFVRTSMSGLLAWKRRHRCLLVGTSPSAEEDY